MRQLGVVSKHLEQVEHLLFGLLAEVGFVVDHQLQAGLQGLFMQASGGQGLRKMPGGFVVLGIGGHRSAVFLQVIGFTRGLLQVEGGLNGFGLRFQKAARVELIDECLGFVGFIERDQHLGQSDAGPVVFGVLFQNPAECTLSGGRIAVGKILGLVDL